MFSEEKKIIKYINLNIPKEDVKECKDYIELLDLFLDWIYHTNDYSTNLNWKFIFNEVNKVMI